MTSVVCWLCKEDNVTQLWAVADSLISREGQTEGVSLLVDLGSKISKLPIKIRLADNFPISHEIHSIGFAFAGSALLAKISREILEMMLSSLNKMESGSIETLTPRFLKLTSYFGQHSDFTEQLPSLHEISNLTARIIQSVIQSHGELALRGTSLEIAIFGYCYQVRANECYTVKVTESSNINDIKAIKHNFLDNLFCILGDKKRKSENS